ncbi:MAG TPA: N-methyl-L-tryptophan oxidase [Blastocatellia bacterium]|nr:N-methyl-L-tryptophan oxidase [Blastocatellia bacterium]
MQSFDIVIIGAGVMGAAAACEAARGGARVALIDQARPPNPRAASTDHSKVFRFAYPDAMYARLAVEALAGWQAIEAEMGVQLLTPTGLLLMGKAESRLEVETAAALAALGLEAELMSSAEAAARFPQFNPAAFAHAVYDPSGAITHAERAVETMIALAQRRGVTVIESLRVLRIEQAAGAKVRIVTETGGALEAGGALVAAGPWTRRLLPALSPHLVTTRQEIVYFEPRRDHEAFAVGRLPIFIDFGSGFYGFPVHHANAMKVGNHHRGLAVEMSEEPTVGPEFIARCRDFFAEFIPRLADAAVRETRVCVYNNTPDEDFIIDWHTEVENVLIATGFSGHGFKFGPVVGRITAELLLSGQTSFDITRFRLARFAQ